MGSASPINAIGFDLEHCYSATLLDGHISESASHLEQSVEKVCDLLRRHDTKATFFIVGELATEVPEIIRQIKREGHEIASHGHTHRPLSNLGPNVFEQEVQKAEEAIQSTVGVEPIGFRAPDFSITEKTAWALDILVENGYQYDSSVFPMRTPLYGISRAPVRPYNLSLNSPFQTAERAEADIIEFPVSVVDHYFRYPIAGGFYARTTPLALIKYGIKRLNNRGIAANLYFHPWELNPTVKTKEPPIHKRYISFWGIEKLERKIEALLSEFEFSTVENVLAQKRLLGDEQTQRSSDRGYINP